MYTVSHLNGMLVMQADASMCNFTVETSQGGAHFSRSQVRGQVPNLGKIWKQWNCRGNKREKTKTPTHFFSNLCCISDTNTSFEILFLFFSFFKKKVKHGYLSHFESLP